MEPLSSISSTLHCAEDADEVACCEAPGAWESPPSPFLESSSDDAHSPVADFLSAELEHAPRPGYLARLRDGSLDSAKRLDAINWILKLHGLFRFQPMTGFLSVNYLDRFLSSQTLPKGVGWPWQLLSVACLSVAAKMEETDAPPPLELQVLEPRFVFDPRTVERMELLLMATLRWRMHPVTPFDFVGHFAGLLGSRRAALLSRASDLVLGTQRVVEFLGYRPSEIAAAAVLCAAGGGGDDISRVYDMVSKEAVGECRRLMEEYLQDTCRPPELTKDAPAGSDPPGAPLSPIGVLDAAACGSCDSQKSAAEPEPEPEPESGAVEPPAKRRRLSCPCTRSTNGNVVGREDR